MIAFTKTHPTFAPSPLGEGWGEGRRPIIAFTKTHPTFAPSPLGEGRGEGSQ
jgi:hypothetical protein